MVIRGTVKEAYRHAVMLGFGARAIALDFFLRIGRWGRGF